MAKRDYYEVLGVDRAADTQVNDFNGFSRYIYQEGTYVKEYSIKVDDKEENHWHIDEMACVPEIISLFENWKGPSQKLGSSSKPALGPATTREEARHSERKGHKHTP